MKRNRVGLATVLVVVLAGLWGDSPAGALGPCSAIGTCNVACGHLCIDNGVQSNGRNYGVCTGSTATMTIHVGKGDQTITFTSTAPAGATVGGPTYTVTATASSGLTVAFTIDASASSVCSISGSTVSFIGVGTCVIDANQAGNANYNPAPQVQQSFAVGMGG
jgi:hypothetical protein